MPPRKRKAAETKPKDSTQPLISEEEQRRLVQDSGILQKLPQSRGQAEPDDDSEQESFADEVFNAILLIMPFSFLLILMEILIHQQYGKQVSIRAIFDRLVSGVPILSIFIFYTNRYKAHRRTKHLMFLLSLVVGPRFIYIINKASWITNMKQCPPLATLWIYTVVQLDLGPAVASLGLIGAWFWWSGFSIALYRST